MKLSIIISSHNRSKLFRRTLFYINKHRPSKHKFEVIVVDDGSDEQERNDILVQLRRYQFPYTFVEIDKTKWEKNTGLKVYGGNPVLTNNIGFYFSCGKLVSLVGNECIVYSDYDDMIGEFESKDNKNAILFTTTYDINLPLNDDGTNLSQLLNPQVLQKPLQSPTLHTDVTNYCSITSASLWEEIGGYDEIYLSGIACDDSDFVRRAALLPGFEKIRSEFISFHQNHGGKTMYDEPLDIEYAKKFYKGLLINREVYMSWDGKRIKPLVKNHDCIKLVTVGNYGN